MNEQRKPIETQGPPDAPQSISMRGLIAVIASVGVVALIYSLVGPLLA